ncbi:Eukaryotic translation initiation factor 3 subunit c [Thalictrum thalictroides]|uniref:Eukaryotic translation initiation factor 3 subunit c n=2 Tax=Thalictrum thalictroides TaxID=46969 RepID=A0A7J6X324_THATH|nr:Eukaryotic translation initiation factor 3 subunit c [Thalictrum thalictroides]
MAMDSYELDIIEKEFDRLNKMFGRSLTIIKEPPEYYVNILMRLEDFFLSSQDNSDYFNYIKDKILFHCQEYEFFIQELRENPESSGDDEEREETTVYSDWDSEDEELFYNAKGSLWEREKKKLIRRFTNHQITWKTVSRYCIALRSRDGKGCLIKMEELSFLSRVARTPAQKLKILRALVYSRFHAMPGGRMPINVWIKCLLDMFEMFDILSQYPNIVMDHKLSFDSDTRLGSDYQGEIQISGNLCHMYIQTHTEFVRILQSIKQNTGAYRDMLDCEPMLFVLSRYVQKYLEAHGYFKKAAKVAFTQMQLLYYKSKEAYDAMFTLPETYSDSMYKVLVENQWLPLSFVAIAEPVPRRPIHVENLNDLMDSLHVLIKKYGDQQIKTYAMMYDIYHRAILDRFSKSTKLPSMKNLWDQIQNENSNMVIVFNRTKAQLGLCAFRIGHIRKAHSLLSDICTTEQTVEEVLDQGVSQSSFSTFTPKQERLKRRRQLPCHMHVNLEILKAVHLICTILLAVPNMAKSLDPEGDEVVRKTFRRLLERSVTKTLSEPTIREEALRIYLLTYSSYAELLSMNKLSTFFSLSKDHIKNIVETMRSERLHSLL